MNDDVRGVAFPFSIDPATGGVAWASGREKIRQDVRLMLSTRYGERPMLRDFGTRLHSLLHDPNDDVLADLLRNQVQETLIQWEPRILVTEIQIEQQEGEVRLRLDYIHTSEPVTGQMILPLG